MESKRAPFGTWNSLISAESITKSANTSVDVVVDRITSEAYYLESRPSEHGRNVLVGLNPETDIVGPNWNVRNQVHEFGGGGAIVCDGVAFFCNLDDGRVYSVSTKVPGSEPEPVTPENKPYRYACLEQYPCRSDILAAVLEDHTTDTPSQVVNTLITIDTAAKAVRSLLSGADFYAFPKFSPDGRRLAWVQWSHPDMPWEGGEIHAADVSNSNDKVVSIVDIIHVAGVHGKVSAGYPAWADNDTLIFLSDVSGFINPWKFSFKYNASSPLFPEPISEDFAAPLWQLNFFPYSIIGTQGVFSSFKNGRAALYLVDIHNHTAPESIQGPSTDFVVVGHFRTIPSKAAALFIGQTSNKTKAIVELRLSASKTEISILKGGGPLLNRGIALPQEYISAPQPITLKISPNNLPIHVVYYTPRNPAYSGSSIDGEKPPCIVNVHGGPTGLTEQSLDVTTQYFTSRGWAWLDVNYGGSSGYGRAYVEKLNGNWGIVDVQDCILAPQTLATAPYGFVDKNRLIIRGGSAGGFTTLASLSTASDVTVFAAATSLYGVSDLKKLTEFTHKFESHYLDHLLGGNVDEIPEVYNERSPLRHTDKIVTPLLILQGEIDVVVPKEQSELIYKSILDRGGEVEYKLYPGEGHGWRLEETMRDSYERELAFYKRILKL